MIPSNRSVAAWSFRRVSTSQAVTAQILSPTPWPVLALRTRNTSTVAVRNDSSHWGQKDASRSRGFATGSNSGLCFYNQSLLKHAF
jgi:hypothetical protein